MVTYPTQGCFDVGHACGREDIVEGADTGVDGLLVIFGFEARSADVGAGEAGSGEVARGEFAREEAGF